MELKVGQIWEDGNPYPRWASIRIDEIEGNFISYTVFGMDGSDYGKNYDLITSLKTLMEVDNYTLSKSHSFSTLYNKLCSTN